MTARFFEGTIIGMDKLITIINKLIQKDQEAIKSFRRDQITKEGLLKTSCDISREFLVSINNYGFPYYNLVEKDIYTSAITLSLHLDLRQMKPFFDKFINNRPGMEILPNDKAMFIDKILVLSGQNQIYGTQYKVDREMNAELLPLQNEKEIDKIRYEAGLQPLKDYIAFVKQAFKDKAKEK